MSDRREEQALLATLHSGKWLRVNGQNVNRFEQAYARMFGAKGCLATCNGTSALTVSLKALGVAPGDEVIVPPYTFIATVNAVMSLYAVPVFVDTDRETGQMDASKIEAAITDRTAAILPVHLGGSAVDLDRVLAIADRRRLPVVEDACQAHWGEWRNRKLGTFGATGCFSFQATKNMTCGEGGALLSDDEALLEKCFAIHSHGRPRTISGYNFTYEVAGTNLRMDELHAALATVQLGRLQAQSDIRNRNAQLLTKLLEGITGVLPMRMYPGCTRNAWHLFMFRYQPEAFAGLPRGKFVKALIAEGIPASTGYSPLNQESFLRKILAGRDYQAHVSKERLARWEKLNSCPENDKLCSEAVWLTHSMLLGTSSEMEQIADAVRKIQAHADALRRA
jgi:dTDP-4-amino-4,6-dideoxygalactose transaminase